jgi:ribulose-phosphate 3-epimerase
MIEIVPTILTSTVEEFRRYADSYSKFIKRVQIDISDGIFTPSMTINEANIWWPDAGITADLHMMVAEPSKHMDAILRLKPSLCIFHAETNESLMPIFEQLHGAGIKCGIAFLPRTFPGKYDAELKAADHALIFAGQIGQQGGEIDMLQTEKIPIIRAINHDLEIGWDGGINMTNIRALAHADLDVLNVGSAIATAPDPAAALKELDTEADRPGVLI